MKRRSRTDETPVSEIRLPRKISLTTYVALVFGGQSTQTGAAVFTFAMIGVWVVLPHTAALDSFKFMLGTSSTKGVVTQVEDSGMAEGGGGYSSRTSRYREPIYEVYFQYEVNGSRYSSSSYGKEYTPRLGSSVDVEYSKLDPSTARIAGTRETALGPVTYLILLLPIPGLLLLGYGLCQNIRSAGLVRGGRLTRGRLILKLPTRFRSRKRVVYEYTFEFDDESGRTHHASGRSHDTQILEDEETERLLYNPSDPQKSVLVDTLSGKPQFSEDGSVQTVGISALKYVVLPVGGALVHVGIGVLFVVL